MSSGGKGSNIVIVGGSGGGGSGGVVIQDSLYLESGLNAQLPNNLNTHLVINFNPASVTSTNGFISYDVGIDKLSLAEGVYTVTVGLSYGREGGAGESNLFFASRSGPLGSEVESNSSVFAKLNNANIVIPASLTYTLDIPASGAELDFILWRDAFDNGNNSGGLYDVVPDRSPGGVTPSASANIFKIG